MLRLKYMIQFANSTNLTWDYTAIGYWSTLEVHVGIIIACLPAVRSLQRRIFPSTRTQNSSYYLGPAGAYGYNSKGGSSFPSSIGKSKGPSNVTTVGSQAGFRSRERTPSDKEFIQLEEFEFHLGDKAEKGEVRDHGKKSIQLERPSTNSDDGPGLLPMQGSRGHSPPRELYQNSGRNPGPFSGSRSDRRNSASPQFITVTKQVDVSYEMGPDQLSSSPPPRDSDDMVRGRSESQVGLTHSSAIQSRSSSQKRLR